MNELVKELQKKQSQAVIELAESKHIRQFSKEEREFLAQTLIVEVINSKMAYNDIVAVITFSVLLLFSKMNVLPDIFLDSIIKKYNPYVKKIETVERVEIGKSEIESFKKQQLLAIRERKKEIEMILSNGSNREAASKAQDFMTKVELSDDIKKIMTTLLSAVNSANASHGNELNRLRNEEKKILEGNDDYLRKIMIANKKEEFNHEYRAGIKAIVRRVLLEGNAMFSIESIPIEYHDISMRLSMDEPPGIHDEQEAYNRIIKRFKNNIKAFSNNVGADHEIRCEADDSISRDIIYLSEILCDCFRYFALVGLVGKDIEKMVKSLVDKYDYEKEKQMYKEYVGKEKS